MFKTNTIYHRDCQWILSDFTNESVDLIYVDPSFCSKQYEVLRGSRYELRVFEGRWKRDKNYIAWMEPKIGECHRILKETGSACICVNR